MAQSISFKASQVNPFIEAFNYALTSFRTITNSYDHQKRVTNGTEKYSSDWDPFAEKEEKRVPGSPVDREAWLMNTYPPKFVPDVKIEQQMLLMLPALESI
ncbi:hypothetical protein BDB01DRAFT_853657 [Pilobolus umbonatus]|nr:hypothetical protein BDB01DRAFT_853657 [Pilobolus umbonatus]